MLSAASVEDDDCASVTPLSEASGSSSANPLKKRKSRIGSSFKAFQFHLMIKTDLRDGTTASTAVEKEMLLKEHLRTSTGHKMPPSITGLVVFCDRSLFSQPPDSDGLVSIEVLGYVQAKSSTPLSTMKKWSRKRQSNVSRKRQSNGRPAVLWLATRGLLRCRQRCRCARESARFK